MKKITIILIIISFAFPQSVEIKDSNDNTLFEVKDTGATGAAGVDAMNIGSGGVTIGDSGTQFIEIQEITDFTTNDFHDIYSDKLPVGWTGENTRVLSFEIRETNDPNSDWISVGNDGGASVEFRLEHSTRTIWIIQNGQPPLQGKKWRMMIMKMP